MFWREENDEWGSFKDGNENRDFKYVGEIRNGLPHGQGTETFPNGQKYVGKFKDAKKNGKGTFTFPDGRKYVGEFKDGTQHGQGT